MSNKIQKETPKPKVTGQPAPNTNKQVLPQRASLSPVNKQNIPQIVVGKKATFGQNNPNIQINAIKTMAADVMTLRKENAELKAKLADAQKNPKTQ